jgi:hypothetical protein
LLAHGQQPPGFLDGEGLDFLVVKAGWFGDHRDVEGDVLALYGFA